MPKKSTTAKTAATPAATAPKKSRKKAAPASQPIVIPTDDISSQDLGSGWTLKFQRSTVDPKKVRAVIYNDKNEIWVRGSIVDESNALSSRLEAIAKSKEKNYKLSLGLSETATTAETLQALENQILNSMRGVSRSAPPNGEYEGDKTSWHIRLVQRNQYAETWALYYGNKQESSETTKNTAREWCNDELKKMKR